MKAKKPLLFIPSGETLEVEEALDRFLEYVKIKNLELYPAQEEAILEIFNGHNVILKTPTGSGKSLVAMASHYYALARGERSFYTSPVKALVNEKFFSLCCDFGAARVGLITGDAKVNPDAPIVCCTAEILANMALKERDSISVHDVVVDEFHYYSDRDRGSSWQIPLLLLRKTRFLLMSATFGDTDFFEKELTSLNGKKTTVVFSDQRPVPLDFRYSEESLDETLGDLVALDKAPVYVVHFTQREAAILAQSLMSFNFSSKDTKKKISEELKNYHFSSPYGKEINKYLRHGVGLHHAGILPKYRILTEQLAQKGLLKIICGTDTLGVGVNIPIRTVLLTKMCKFDGKKTTLLSVRDFHQICGRAGRKGFDDQGYVVVQAPEHVIENIKLERKAKASGKTKKVVKAKPPEKGYLPWDENTFKNYLSASPETLRSNLSITHGLVLNVLSGEGDACKVLKDIYKNAHESQASKIHLRREGFQVLRSLVDRKIVEFIPPHERIDTALRLNFDLQDNFLLTEPLALFLLDIVKFLDPMDDIYDLNILSLVESIIENPDVILRKQVDRLRGEKVYKLKEEGLDYEDRMEELEKVEHEKPMKEFLYENFNRFRDHHPWLANENVRPKSIVREMYSTYQTFAEYVREYGLQRSEGVLLRYLSSVYKVLVHTVPDHLKTDAVDEVILYLKTEIKSTDSSLLDEWEKMHDPQAFAEKKEQAIQEAAATEEDITRNQKTLEKNVRNKILRFLKALSLCQYEYALSFLEASGNLWNEKTLEEVMAMYYENHKNLSLAREARRPENIQFDMSTEGLIIVEQTMVDDELQNDWYLQFKIDFEKTKSNQEVSLVLLKISER